MPLAGHKCASLTSSQSAEARFWSLKRRAILCVSWQLPWLFSLQLFKYLYISNLLHYSLKELCPGT
jgi:hypothetical protein